MLETITAHDIDTLRNSEGEKRNVVAIREERPGTTIKVKTRHNCYLFEVTDPAQCKAHVVRCDSTEDTPKSGWRGERTVSSEFRVGGLIFHNDSRTSRVESISILDMGFAKS